MPNVLSKPAVDRMPVELLASVFCVANLADIQLNGMTAKFKFVLAAVCTHWRNVACTTPALWNQFTVTVDTDPTFLEFLFARTRSLPLFVCIHLERYDNGGGLVPGTAAKPAKGNTEEFCTTVIPVLAAKFHEVAELQVRGSSHSFMRRLLGLLAPLHRQALKRLDLEVQRVLFRALDWHPAESESVMDLFGGHSALSSLRLVGLPLLHAATQFTEVTELDLHGAPWPLKWSSIVQNLIAMRNLHTLGLSGIVCPEYDTDSVTALPAVKTLRLSITTADSARPLELLNMSALETCRLWVIVGSLQPVLTALSYDLSNVRRLELYAHFNDVNLPDILRHTPKLETLDLSQVKLDVFSDIVILLKSQQLELVFLREVFVGEYMHSVDDVADFLQGTMASLTMPCPDEGFSRERWYLGSGGSFARERYVD